MAKTVRIHTLSKELGVPSKVIIDKCKAEGIDVKNHMAAIQLGLAESIREWFSAGDDVTSVESAEKVDIDKVRVARPKHEESAGESQEGGSAEGGVAVAVDESAAEAEAPASAEPEDEGLDIAAAAPAEAPPAPVVEEPEPVTPEPRIAAEAPAPEPRVHEPIPMPPPVVPVRSTVAPAARIPVPPPAGPPKRIEPVRPAGPMVVPAPAELKGPRVVRIEAPEQDQRRPRPAGPGGPRPPGPGGPRPFEPAVPGAADRGGPRKPGKKGDDAVPSRSRSPRRHGDVVEVSERMKEWRDRDIQERRERLASASGHGLKAWRSAEQRRSKSHSGPSTAPRKNEAEITTPIAVKEFCNAVGITFSVINKKVLEQHGKLLRVNDMLDTETAELIAMELGITLRIVAAKSPLEKVQDRHAALERKHLKPRPPVVAMLGHVDHGKTSLLDAIRQANVAKGEAGGITQHIGAYRVDRGDWHVTFIDTPGHEAFTSMRARGANLTDVVVLVVAADDGVMPQTIEAMNHAKAAGVQIVVALNKIDLPGADLNKIYGQLAEHELTPSEWGGTTDVLKTSATKGVGVDELLAHLSTLSDLLDLKADATVPAKATVIEARMKEGRGVVAQVLVREGTLKPGQVIVCGPASGKVRALIDDRGRPVKEAGPSTPVEVLGLDEIPSTGDVLFKLDDLAEAKEIAADMRLKRREESLSATRKPRGLEDLLKSASTDELPELNVIVKADVDGSLEAIRGQLTQLPTDKARLRLLHTAVGAITEADVSLAQASDAIVIGFNVVPESGAERAAEQVGVQIRQYRVIYEMLDDVQKAMEGLLEPEKREEARGKAEVREVFNITKVGTIAGCIVKDGVIQRSCKVRLIRDGRIILEGNGLDSLKRFKDDAREVRSGLECGIKIANFDDVKPGDIIEAYDVVEVAQKLR